jgi:hypothetical protein
MNYFLIFLTAEEQKENEKSTKTRRAWGESESELKRKIVKGDKVDERRNCFLFEFNFGEFIIFCPVLCTLINRRLFQLLEFCVSVRPS